MKNNTTKSFATDVPTSGLAKRLREHDDPRLYYEADVLMSQAADEINRLRQSGKDALDATLYALKLAPGLYSLGYNSHHASTLVDKTDCTGCTEDNYDKEANRQFVVMKAAEKLVREALKDTHEY